MMAITKKFAPYTTEFDLPNYRAFPDNNGQIVWVYDLEGLKVEDDRLVFKLVATLTDVAHPIDAIAFCGRLSGITGGARSKGE